MDVTVHPDSYPQGATDGTLTFRVPDEEDSARTIRVQVVLPADHPIPSVLVTSEAGWTPRVKTSKLKKPITTDDAITEAVSEITWTKGAIQPGRYQDFHVAFGQLPDDTDQLVFKTVQTYSDGKVSRWIEEPRKGGEEPEDPAPTPRLTKPANAKSPARAAAAKTSAAADDSNADDSNANDSTARTLGITGLTAGVFGLAAAAFALIRTRSTRRP
ncbi:YcnI family protein [Streptomyces sp. NPDC005336]|uniref:YcnI family protein n=1 Tax=Streptomyces sp. NPDC005336 TaxID=3157035 RepID=UPI0033A5B487